MILPSLVLVQLGAWPDALVAPSKIFSCREAIEEVSVAESGYAFFLVVFSRVVRCKQNLQ